MWLTVRADLASPTIRSTAQPSYTAARHHKCGRPQITMMTRVLRRALLALTMAGVAALPAQAQYFGRNKVQYEKFDWRILKTDHFDLFFYPAESIKVHDAGRQSERWYARLSDIFRHQFDRKSIVWYADHPDFQQTNVIG